MGEALVAFRDGKGYCNMHFALLDTPQKKSGGVSPAALIFRPEPLDALRLALFVGRSKRRRPDVHSARLGGRGMRHRRGETVSRHRNGGADNAARHVIRRAE